MADFSALIGKTYEYIRTRSQFESFLIDKELCCFVKGKDPTQIVTLLSSYTDETDFYAVECRTGSLLFIQPNLFNEIKTLITDTGVIVQVQTNT